MRGQKQERQQNHGDAGGCVHGLCNPLRQLIVLRNAANLVEEGLRRNKMEKNKNTDVNRRSVLPSPGLVATWVSMFKNQNRQSG